MPARQGVLRYQPQRECRQSSWRVVGSLYPSQHSLLYTHDTTAAPVQLPGGANAGTGGVVIDLVDSPDVSAHGEERRVRLKKRKLDLIDCSNSSDDPNDLRQIL